MTPFVVENGPPVTFLRTKMTGGRFSIGVVIRRYIGIPMGTNCAPLLADMFLYSYEAEFIQSLLSTGKKKIASQFNFTYRYIDDVLSINNPDFENYLGQMYPAEL